MASHTPQVRNQRSAIANSENWNLRSSIIDLLSSTSCAPLSETSLSSLQTEFFNNPLFHRDLHAAGPHGQLGAGLVALVLQNDDGTPFSFFIDMAVPLS
jgi:hypothetical protein